MPARPRPSRRRVQTRLRTALADVRRRTRRGRARAFAPVGTSTSSGTTGRRRCWRPASGATPRCGASPSGSTAAQEGLEHPQVVELAAALTGYLEYAEAIRVADGDLPGEYRRRVDATARCAGRGAVRLRRARRRRVVARRDAAGARGAGAGSRALQRARDRRADPPRARRGQARRCSTRRSQEQRPTRNNIQGATVVGHGLRRFAHVRRAVGRAHRRPGPHHHAGPRPRAAQYVDLRPGPRDAARRRRSSRAVADLYWDGRRFVATTPQVTADMHSTMRGINAPWLIRRAAARRVAGSRGAAEAQGESIVERNVAESMTARLADRRREGRPPRCRTS